MKQIQRSLRHLFVAKVVIGTDNVVTHSIPYLNLTCLKKKGGGKKRAKIEEVRFFSLDKLGSAWLTTFSAPITTLGTCSCAHMSGEWFLVKWHY